MVDTVVILAGGSGTRLWPLSSRKKPKQFVDIGTGKTLIRHTLDRAACLGDLPIVVVTHENQADQLRAELEGQELTILEEPQALNTAPAIALAVAQIRKTRSSASILVLASDHLIEPDEAFVATVEEADALARQGYIVTLGIKPTAPETGYGYIEKGQQLGKGAWKVAAFTEKPDAPQAERYYAHGEHFWNSGMFLFTTDTIEKEFDAQAPAIATMLRELEAQGLSQTRRIYQKTEAISIDYAVMEKSNRCAVVAATFSWSDVGSWDELFRLAESGLIARSKQDVHVLTPAPVYTEDAASLLVHSEIPVAVVGLSDITVVVKDGVLLVAKRGCAQHVKTIAQKASDARKDRPSSPGKAQ